MRQYLTSENAAADFHAINAALSKVLDAPWVTTGTSRGGEVCASYAYYYPEDMKLSVPYVAPFSSGVEDERMYEFVYTKIGDEKYGEAQATESAAASIGLSESKIKRKNDMIRTWRFVHVFVPLPYLHENASRFRAAVLSCADASATASPLQRFQPASQSVVGIFSR